MSAADSAIVILAAGASRRLGSPKQLLPWGSSSLLQDRLAMCRELNLPLWLTLGANAEACWAALDDRCDLRRIDVADHADGLSGSIRAAVAVAQTQPSIARLLILPLDQYRVDAGWLRELLALAERWPQSMIASCCAGLRGAPAVFPRAYFSALASLQGDAGARRLLRETKPPQVIDLQREHCPGDLDTIDDLHAARGESGGAG